jgi:hypothetical protein
MQARSPPAYFGFVQLIGLADAVRKILDPTPLCACAF